MRVLLRTEMKAISRCTTHERPSGLFPADHVVRLFHGEPSRVGDPGAPGTGRLCRLDLRADRIRAAPSIEETVGLHGIPPRRHCRHGNGRFPATSHLPAGTRWRSTEPVGPRWR